MEEKTKISAVLITYKRLETLKKCVDSLLSAKTGEVFEILILVNGDDPDSFLYLKELSDKFAFIKARKSPKLCRGEARNTLIKEAAGTHICFLDDDTVLPSAYFKNLAAKILLFKDAAVIGGGEIIEEKKSSSFQRALSFAFRSFWGAGPFKCRYSPAKGDRRAFFEEFILANLTVKTAVLRGNNLVFEGHLTSAEENLLLNKIAALGGKMIISEDLNLWHEKRKTFLSLILQVFKSAAGRAEISFLYPKSVNLFTLLPLAGLLFAFFVLVLNLRLFGYVLFFYVLVNAFFAFKCLWVFKKTEIAVKAFLIFPLIHSFYALGYLYGGLFIMIDKCFSRKKPFRCVCGTFQRLSQ